MKSMGKWGGEHIMANDAADRLPAVENEEM
jgi:hypothetical protein